ncbi:MAG: hypothetical protein L3J67_06265 [Hyphomicrobiaceae bacterium]|nr:hypothetical protein [Hyphomicrobiaceae bacterium]
MKIPQLALAFFLFLSGCALADLPTGRASDLAQSLKNYQQATIDQNVDQVMMFTYPGMFKILPKEQMRQGLVEMYGKGAAPKIRQMVFSTPGSPRPYSRGQFVVIKYHVKMEVPRPGDATPDIDRHIIKIMKRQLGEAVVVIIDEKNSLIKISRDTEMIVLNEDNQGWKMIEKDNLGWLIRNGALPEDLAKMLQPTL